MRILYVTNGFPFPLTSGYLRHYHLIRELSERHSITLFSLVNDDFDGAHVEALHPFTDQVQVFRRTTLKQGWLSKSFGGSRMLAFLCPAVRQLWDAVEWQAGNGDFDVAFFSGKFTLPSRRRLQHVPAIADICDTGSVRLRGRLQLANWRQKPQLFAKYLLMRRLEEQVRRRSVHSVFASCRDRDALTSAADDRATVVPNGVDLDYWKRTSSRPGPDTIIFTGAMHYGPNVDAALYLIRDIFPLVRQAVPEAQLLIVGRDPLDPLLIQATATPGVRVTGFVEDMRPYLERATCFAAPLRFAAGIQNKVLEAMAMEMHIVASPAAAGGVRTEQGREAPIEVAANASSFAQALIRQLHAGRTSPAINPQTREYVRQHFGWQQGAAKLEQVLTQAAGRRLRVPVSKEPREPLIHTASG